MADAGEARAALPVPETEELGRYLEDTITIDWQTPAVTSQAQHLLEGVAEPESRVRRLFAFVRDEISHSLDVVTHERACRASEVLRARTGLCYAKSHLLAGLLRYAGYPTGFCYARLESSERPGRFELHGFNAVYWRPGERWIFLDARGDREGRTTECRFEAPFSLAHWPQVDRGESFLPFVYKRPARRIVDLLERAPDFEAIRRNLPDSV